MRRQLLSAAQCEAAALALILEDLSVFVSPSTSRGRPPGCYYRTQPDLSTDFRLNFNPSASKEACTMDRQCVCATVDSCARSLDDSCWSAEYPCEACCARGVTASGASCWNGTLRTLERCCTPPTPPPTPLAVVTLTGFSGCGGFNLDGGYYFAGTSAGFPRCARCRSAAICPQCFSDAPVPFPHCPAGIRSAAASRVAAAAHAALPALHAP